MIIKRRCDVCGAPYVAKLSSSRFCGGTCRARASRMSGVPASLAVLEVASAVEVTAGTVAAVRVELEAVEQASSALGAMALALASRIDNSVRETGPALASLTRELRLTMGEARASGRHASSIAERLGDELAVRRASRGG